MTRMGLQRPQAEEIAREALTRLTRCGAIVVPEAQEEYDSYVNGLLQVITDSALVVVNGSAI